MQCPYCGQVENRVIDSRLTRESQEIRRRRECEECGRRFTTRERVEQSLPKIIKRDERREEYDRAKLEAYEREYEPAYVLLKDLSAPEIERVRRVVIDDLHIDALPAAIATDAEGRVLRTMWEVPSVSEVKALLSELTS